MLKKPIALILAFLLTITAFAVVVSAESVKDDLPPSNRDEYTESEAEGGTVKNINDLVKALGEENLKVDESKSTVTLIKNIRLKSPIIIEEGSYTVNGGGCTVFRAFDGAYFITLSSDEVSKKIEFKLKGKITFDGMNDKEEYSASKGLIYILGNVNFEAERVNFENSDADGNYGGAVLAVPVSLSDEIRTVLAPNIKLTECEFKRCKAECGGGAIATVSDGNYECNVEISSCVFNKNSALENDAGYSDGGAIYASAGNFTIKGCTFNGNSADNGGAIYANYKTEINNCKFEYNEARRNGGAIYTLSEISVTGDSIGSATIENCTAGNNGGAIAGKGRLTTKNVYIADNSAALNGGGVYFEGTYEFDNSVIRTCTAGKIGGGIYLKAYSSKLNMTDGEIYGCTAEYCASLYNEGGFDFGGGAIGEGKSEFPQIFVCGEVKLGASSCVQSDVFALSVEENDGKKVYPSFILSEIPTFTSSFKIAYATVKLDNDGNFKEFSNATGRKAVFFSGNSEAVKKARELFEVEGRGALSYALKSDGSVSVRFLHMPVWLCIIICVLIFGGVAFVFWKKLTLAFCTVKDKLVKKNNR